jgi:dTDP-glucose 4,6-dehydratase
VSTDEVYGDLEAGGSSTDTDALRPSSPYSAAKSAGDLLVSAYARTFGVNASITRGSNTYGPNQYPEKFIPLFATNALDGEPLPLYGDGLNQRDWLYVDDHCAGIDLVLRKGAAGEIYNIGAGNETANRVLVDKLLALLGVGEEMVRYVDDRLGHDRRYSVDITKVAALGWRKQRTFDEALEATVAWYRDNRWWWEPLKQAAIATP